MGHIIIGHTSETSARIWVCGERGTYRCRIDVRSVSNGVGVEEAIPPQTFSLNSRDNFTAVRVFTSLKPGRTYVVTATFYPLLGTPRSIAEGRFETFPDATFEDGRGFSFMLSSCNLSVMNINDLMGLLLAQAGVASAVNSLNLEWERWRFRVLRSRWLTRVIGWLLGGAVWLVASPILAFTNAKQPAPPFLRSPFLKLSAAFDAWAIDVLAPDRLLPTAGDILVGGVATGVVACTPFDAGEVASKDKTGKVAADRPRRWRIVVTQVAGRFEKGADLRKRRPGEDKTTAIGRIVQSQKCKPWLEPPAFYIHAGDQIYYDVPEEHREPRTYEYRLAYREAFFYDDANRYLLSHWPSYMTLDDHEIADQYARDFSSPSSADADTYYRKAMSAYREFVQPRNPVDAGAQLTAAEEDEGRSSSYWYRFDKGPVKFFVLDTRTQRRNLKGNGQGILDDRQLRHFLEWLEDNRDALKFVVTSVPFVAQIRDKVDDPPPTWSGKDGSRDVPASPEPGVIGARNRDDSTQKGNDANDKWSSPRYKRQRDLVIDWIAEKRIEQLVFLTGDMHCCYHATMRIGSDLKSKYEMTTVHELAGGPANQLQLGYLREFEIHHRGCTTPSLDIPQGVPYVIDLDRFHGEVNAVMHLTVSYGRTPQIVNGDQALVPSVRWSVLRTLTDEGASAWEVEGEQARVAAALKAAAKGDPVADQDVDALAVAAKVDARIPDPAMSGLITFARRRTPAELRQW